MVGGGLRRCVPEAVAVQLLEPERPELRLPERCQADPCRAVRLGPEVMSGAVPDPTGGATHYYAITMPKAPAWAAKATQTLRLGNHVFFKDVP